VYEGVREITSDVVNVSGMTCKMGPGNGMFDMEIHLHRLLLRTPCRTTDPRDAHVLYVPVYPNKYACDVAIRTNGTYHIDVYRRAFTIGTFDHPVVYLIPFKLALDAVRKQPHWARHQGRDHVFTVTHGFAYDALPVDVRNHSILLLSHGNRYIGFNESRHVIIPPSLTRHALDAGQPSNQLRPWSERPLLASFKGVIRPYWKHSFGIRQLWADLYEHSRDILIENDRDSDYARAIDAVFCLCPPGFYAWTPRPIEALFYGCIPVVVGEELILPFDSVLPWPDLAVHIPFDDAVRLELILRQILPDTRTAMQLAGRSVLPQLSFDPDYEPHPGDITSALLASISKLQLHR